MFVVAKVLTVVFIICSVILTALSIFCTCAIGFQDTESVWEKIFKYMCAITMVCGVIDLIILFGFMIFAIIAS